MVKMEGQVVSGNILSKKKDGNMSWAVSNKTSNILYKDREQKTLI